MKILGHPIHPLLIHFPTALLPMDFVLSILHYYTGNGSFALAGYYCLIGGVLMGFAAIVTGLIELIYIPKTNKQALGTSLIHGFINGFVLLVFAVIAYKAWQEYPQPGLSTTAGLLIKGILIITLFIGNYLGGRLIYKHHIGINLKTTEHGKAAS